jgi:cysteinyl-tRNA synthetase
MTTNTEIKTWQEEAEERALTANEAAVCMIREIADLRSALEAKQQALEAAQQQVAGLKRETLEFTRRYDQQKLQEQRLDTALEHAKELDSGRDAALEKFFTAVGKIDFHQFGMHRNPCWHIEEDGSFCGRDKAWAGHQSGWKYVSLKDAVAAAMAAQQGEQSPAANGGV